ncbi:tyrosine recombinase XerC, partial [Planctomycetota bacterium]
MPHARRRPGRPGVYAKWIHSDGEYREERLPGITSLKEARRKAAELELAAFDEQHGIGRASADVEIDQLKAAWLADIQVTCRPRTIKTYEQDLDAILDAIRRQALTRRRPAPKRVRDLHLADVRAAAGALRRNQSARTVQKKVATLKQMFEWAEHQPPPLRIARNPLAEWKPLKGPKLRQRRGLTDFEIGRLLHVLQAAVAKELATLAEARAQLPAATCPSATRTAERQIRGATRRVHITETLLDAVAVFLGTGIRPGELVALLWSDIDWQRSEVTIREETRKRGETIVIPLRADLVDLLRRRRQRTGTARRHVF